jgi:hypothetical protein
VFTIPAPDTNEIVLAASATRATALQQAMRDAYFDVHPRERLKKKLGFKTYPPHYNIDVYEARRGNNLLFTATHIDNGHESIPPKITGMWMNDGFILGSIEDIPRECLYEIEFPNGDTGIAKTRQSLILFCRFCNSLNNIELRVLQKWTTDYWLYVIFTELPERLFDAALRVNQNWFQNHDFLEFAKNNVRIERFIFRILCLGILWSHSNNYHDVKRDDLDRFIEMVANHQNLDLLTTSQMFLRGFQRAGHADDVKTYFVERITEVLGASGLSSPDAKAKTTGLVSSLLQEGFLVEALPAR